MKKLDQNQQTCFPQPAVRSCYRTTSEQIFSAFWVWLKVLIPFPSARRHSERLAFHTDPAISLQGDRCQIGLVSGTRRRYFYEAATWSVCRECVAPSCIHSLNCTFLYIYWLWTHQRLNLLITESEKRNFMTEQILYQHVINSFLFLCSSLGAPVVFLPDKNKQTVNLRSHQLSSTSPSKLKRGNHETSMWSDVQWSGPVGTRRTGRGDSLLDLDVDSRWIGAQRDSLNTGPPPQVYDSC